jgi:type IX secretion system PorP/SprF family membrane protein
MHLSLNKFEYYCVLKSSVIKRKEYIGFFLLLVAVICEGSFFKSWAQEPVFSQQMFHQLYFNPAFAGETPYPRFTAGYRNQWASLGNTFVSYYASYDQYVKKMMGGLGFSFYRDVQGQSLTRTGAELDYSYHIKFRNIVWSQGIRSSLVQCSVAASTLTLPDDNPYGSLSSQETMTDQHYIYPDFSFGSFLNLREQYGFGFSVHHINFMNRSSANQNYSFQPLCARFMLLGKFQHRNNNKEIERIVYQPGIITMFQQGSGAIQWGSNLKYSNLMCGLWIRNTTDISFNTFIIFVGYQSKGLGLGYSYDLWIPKSNVGLPFYGSHEVTLSYLFQYNDPKKRMKPVACPKFYFKN